MLLPWVCGPARDRECWSYIQGSGYCLSYLQGYCNICNFSCCHSPPDPQSSSAILQDSQHYCQPSLDAIFKEKYSLLLARFPQQRTYYPHHEEGGGMGIKPLKKPGRQTSHILSPHGLVYVETLNSSISHITKDRCFLASSLRVLNASSLVLAFIDPYPITAVQNLSSSLVIRKGFRFLDHD